MASSKKKVAKVRPGKKASKAKTPAKPYRGRRMHEPKFKKSENGAWRVVVPIKHYRKAQKNTNCAVVIPDFSNTTIQVYNRTLDEMVETHLAGLYGAGAIAHVYNIVGQIYEEKPRRGYAYEREEEERKEQEEPSDEYSSRASRMVKPDWDEFGDFVYDPTDL